MDSISWNGVGKRMKFAAPSSKETSQTGYRPYLANKQKAESTASARSKEVAEERGKINRITDRQQQTDSSKSMTKHGPTCDLIGKGFF